MFKGGTLPTKNCLFPCRSHQSDFAVERKPERNILSLGSNLDHKLCATSLLAKINGIDVGAFVAEMVLSLRVRPYLKRDCVISVLGVFSHLDLLEGAAFAGGRTLDAARYGYVLSTGCC